jgi:peptidoglycan/xylan/chitin deacetylase (PgdA/CDA1 family)/uncharacterized caspase-like protein
MRSLVINGLLVGILLLTSTPASTAEPHDFSAIVEHQRQMILLLEGQVDGDTRNERIFAARTRYVQRLQLTDALLSAAAENPATTLAPVVGSLLRFLQTDATLHDADKLAFTDLVDDLLELALEQKSHASMVDGLKQQAAELDSILALYRQEMARVYLQLGMRGSTAREAWGDYIAFLRSRYSVDDLLHATRQQVPLLHEESTRGDAPQDSAAVLWGLRLPEKTVVLTFDDGPSRHRTGAILDTLKDHGVHGYFFAIGQKLGDFDASGAAVLGRNKAIAKRIVEEGHILANHSYSHPVLTKLDVAEQRKELALTNQLIETVAADKARLFRPPYGSRDSALLHNVSQEQLAAVMWNIDSMDWADPVPESIAARVFEQIDKQKKGIILFHDIHKATVAALPLLLEGLSQRGYRVVTVDGGQFSGGGTGEPQLPTRATQPLYGNSWAVVIGINQYGEWPPLRYAVNDAKAIAELLHSKLGFAKENIIELYDTAATRERIVRALGDTLADPRRVKPEDRVFVFFAGHGMTRKLPSGRELGYIIPVDADRDHYQARAISMTHLDDFSELIPAKHVYYVMYSCYSGLALTRSAGTDDRAIGYLQEVTRRRARQILTAGGADQQVADGGPDGHSIFTWTLLQGLEGLADGDGNGYVSASELGTYVAPIVSSYAEQTPAFGNLVGSKGGDFVFKVDAASLSNINRQLEEETRQLESDLHALRSDTKDKLRKRLEAQLALSEAQVQQSPSATPDTRGGLDDQALTEQRVQQARRLNASALQYFAEKRYDKALLELQEAAALNPYNATITNNYGFVLSKLGRNNEALGWYMKTLELQPNRTVLFLNLGDVLMAMERPHEAAPYYRRYLELFPSSPKADEVRATLQRIDSAAGMAAGQSLN